MKKFCSILCIVFVLIFAFTIVISATTPYITYTYSINGKALHSPDAYTPVRSIDSAEMGLEVNLNDPRDIVVDDRQNMYIADCGNNRIVVLDRYGKLKFIISQFVNDNGIPDELTNPAGVFVTHDKIYVCDTQASRIVTFDRDGNFLNIIKEPESTLFDEGAIYKPVAVAVDQYNRLYVVSSSTYQGIIVMTETGEFTGFVGAQAVSIGAWEIIWRRFQTDAQRELSTSLVATEFNNITITDEGFIYVTTSTVKESDVQSFIRSKSSDGKYSPVKMLNAAGDEIMRRNGFWPPAGEIDYTAADHSDTTVGVSKVIDVAVGPENTWSIIDETRNRIFTYDFDGNLLFAFGDSGSQLGNIGSIKALTYQGDKLLVLDKKNLTVTVYERTEYGNILISALANQNNRLYDLAVSDWTEILKRNSNFDTAYIGIGQSLYRSGKYNEAIEYYQIAYDTANYSDAFAAVRKNTMSHPAVFISLIVGIIAIIVGISLFLKHAAKVNKKVVVVGEKRTFREEFMYVFHTMFHPFDGYWDLKHEKRGSLRAGLLILLITIVGFFYQSIGQGYILNPTRTYSTIGAQILGVVVPLLLFALSNWCLTTLFDGEGSFKDILVAGCYSLMPLPIIIIPVTIVSNFLIATEIDILSLITTIAFIWMGFLLIVGVMVTHDYSMGKNILTLVGTIVAMAFIMFLGLLFTSLFGNIISFITNIITEINYRL